MTKREGYAPASNAFTAAASLGVMSPFAFKVFPTAFAFRPARLFQVSDADISGLLRQRTFAHDEIIRERVTRVSRIFVSLLARNA